MNVKGHQMQDDEIACLLARPDLALPYMIRIRPERWKACNPQTLLLLLSPQNKLLIIYSISYMIHMIYTS